MTSSFLLRDVRIFDGEHVINSGFVHVANGKIRAVGPVSDVPQVEGKVYSKPGHTLLPGLIDCHVHIDGADPQGLLQALRFGVTTVCEMGNDLDNINKIKKQSLEPDTASYKLAGQAATIENGWPIPVILAYNNSPEVLADIAKWPKLSNRDNVVEYLDWVTKEMQPDYIKLMHESGKTMGMKLEYPSIELQRMVVEESKKRGLLTVAHATSLRDTLDVLEAGVNGLAHTFYDQPITQEVVDAYKRNNAWVNPTLVCAGSLTTEGKELQHKFAHDPRVKGLIDDSRIGNLCACMGFAAEHGKVEHAYESVRVLKAAGIDILCGSDSTGPALGTAFGLSMHQELHLFVHKVGMTPAEALQSATSLIAKRFNFADRGKLAEGLNADLLLVEGNPLDDIDATLNIRGVWRQGKLCSAHAGAL